MVRPYAYAKVPRSSGAVAWHWKAPKRESRSRALNPSQCDAGSRDFGTAMARKGNAPGVMELIPGMS